MNEALKPYKNFSSDVRVSGIKEDIPLFWHNNNAKMKFSSCKSNFYYKCLVQDKVTEPVSQTKWSGTLDIEGIDFKTIYIKKLVFIKDKKIAEFNFMVLQYILPCNVNLFNWKIRQ